MCPMIPISIIAAFLLALIEVTSASTISFANKTLELTDGQTMNVSFWVEGIPRNETPTCTVSSSSIATVVASNCEIFSDRTNATNRGQFTVEGDLLGYTNVTLKVESESTKSEEDLKVVVKLRKTIIQRVFLGSIIILVSLNYVNMGCALDLNVIKETLRKPIGPAVGLFSQYLVMPLLSFVCATYLLTEPYLQLGLFVFGCSPGGGASNMWAVLLGGNLDLSVTMTFISTVVALAMMPLWLFTLGKTFFKATSPKIPFTNIMSGLVGMVIPLGVGIIMQRYCPKGTAFCRRILAPFSIIMIIFIIIFGTYANLYMIRLITWEIALSAAANVWVGFLLGMVISLASGRSWRDSVTIMIETGVQNTGVAIVLLGVSLPKPDGDMAGVVPVAASSITPIPLTIMWLVLKFFPCSKKQSDRVSDRSSVSFESARKYESIEPLSA